MSLLVYQDAIFLLWCNLHHIKFEMVELLHDFVGYWFIIEFDSVGGVAHFLHYEIAEWVTVCVKEIWKGRLREAPIQERVHEIV